MIKYNNMATAAKAKKEQVDLVEKVAKDKFTEMCHLEARGIRLRAFRKRTKIFRYVKRVEILRNGCMKFIS